MFTFSHTNTPIDQSERAYYFSYFIKTCLHGGGGPQAGEVKYGGPPHLSCKRDQIKMGDYMDKRATSPKRVTSPTWGPHLHLKRP